MAPLMWSTLFLTFSFLLLTVSMKLFYNFKFNKINSNNKNLILNNFKQLNWKW